MSYQDYLDRQIAMNKVVQEAKGMTEIEAMFYMVDEDKKGKSIASRFSDAHRQEIEDK